MIRIISFLCLLIIFRVDFIFSLWIAENKKEHSCVKKSSVEDEIITVSEYQDFELRCTFRLNKNCISKNIQMKLFHNNMLIRQSLTKWKSNIKFEIVIKEVKRNDSGIYTCNVTNEKFTFGKVISVFVHGVWPGMMEIFQKVVTKQDRPILPDAVYWTPTMLYHSSMKEATKHFAIKLFCEFYSITQRYLSASWYASRGKMLNTSCHPYGELVHGNKTPYSILETLSDCETFFQMEKFSGYCLLLELELESVKPWTHDTFTCAINGKNGLARTYNLQINEITYIDDGFDEEYRGMSLRGPDKVCAGENINLLCNVSKNDGRVQLFRVEENGCETLIHESPPTHRFLQYTPPPLNRNSTFLCRWSNFQEKLKTVSVTNCENHEYFVKSMAILLGLGVVGVIITALTIFGLRAKFQKIEPQKLYVMRRVKIKKAIKNPEYLCADDEISDVNIAAPLKIDRKRLIFTDRRLGEGSFGVVYEALMDETTKVAVKVALERGHEMLTSEANLIQQLGHHKHVLNFLGVCIDQGSLCLVMELARGGCLKEFLRICNPAISSASFDITTEKLSVFCIQIAKGMEYLTSKSIVHRDLATRNILLTESGDVKISDFGLTRIVSNYYKSRASNDFHLPVRWMAPESIRENRFTFRTDVWSYGIVMWEIFSLGAMPYFTISTEEIKQAVTAGVINPKPEMALDRDYDLMKRCWSFDDEFRPSFKEIIVLLETDDQYL